MLIDCSDYIFKAGALIPKIPLGLLRIFTEKSLTMMNGKHSGELSHDMHRDTSVYVVILLCTWE